MGNVFLDFNTNFFRDILQNSLTSVGFWVAHKIQIAFSNAFVINNTAVIIHVTLITNNLFSD